ncbi:hypothetical protein BGZ72_001124 [Mortierella alpina]|nr:hypothetical protein BGZ72_001124 [Mortierella alpina]
MSAPPPEQPVYYTPGPAASSPVPVAGTPVYQYQQPGTPGMQYAQPSPNQQHQQPSTLQQPYYPQSPQPMQQQPYYAQPVQQTNIVEQPVVYTTQNVATEVPVVTKGNGRGLTGKMPQFENCCLCFPLHTGAMIIAALMFIFYGYCGLALLVGGGYLGAFGAIMIVIGILYLLVALISAYGFAGIYKEEPFWVDRFIKFYLIGSLIWIVLELVEMIILVIYYNKYFSNSYCSYSYCVKVGFPWAAWIVTFIIGAGFQYYFCCCLVSYQRVLHARLNDLNGGSTTYGNKDIQMQ